MVNALLSQLFLECVAGLNDRKGCIFTNDMKLTRQNMKYVVFILSAMKYKSKVNLEITTFFFYLRFPYCPNFFWFGVVFGSAMYLQCNYSNNTILTLSAVIWFGQKFTHPVQRLWNLAQVLWESGREKECVGNTSIQNLEKDQIRAQH